MFIAESNCSPNVERFQSKFLWTQSNPRTFGVQFSVDPVQTEKDPVQISVDGMETAADPVQISLDPVQTAVDPVQISVDGVDMADGWSSNVPGWSPNRG